jgi:hypothetical protein
MMWRRNLWLLLALAVAIIAWQLTRWITHVNHNPRPIVTIVFDERPPFQFQQLPFSLTAMQRERHRFPEVALTGNAHVLFFVTPPMRSIAIHGVDANALQCTQVDATRGGAAALLVDDARVATLARVAIQTSPEGAIIVIPSSIRKALARARDGRAAIACTFEHPLATDPTFTERAITVRAVTAPGGAALLDVSALEDVDDLRFSGGLQAPLGGDRTRLVYSGDDVVSAEWVDVTAQERRDILLVLIGALSAIAAATAIEAIRPAVERRTKT